MRGYIDLHCHILPGIDDGADSMQETLLMLRQAKEAGYSQIIATPHHHIHRGMATPEKIREVLNEVQRCSDAEGLGILLHGGNELYYSHGLAEDISAGNVMTLADSRYVLLEFSTGVTYKELRQSVLEIQQAGYFPILAHIERYECVVDEPDYAGELYDMGVYIQINAGSIIGDCGRKVKKYTGRLLKEGLVHFVATDAHDAAKRSMNVTACIRYLEKKAGSTLTGRYLTENAEAVLANEVI